LRFQPIKVTNKRSSAWFKVKPLIVYKGKPYRSLYLLHKERKRKGEVEVSLHKIKRLIKDGFSLEEAFDIDINAYSTRFKRKGKKGEKL